MRVLRRWGPARIGYLLGLHPSTVHRVLARYRLARLAWMDRATGRVIRRYEHAHPGDLVHLDVKKLSKIPDGGGWRVLGRVVGSRNSQTHPGPRKRPRQSSGDRLPLLAHRPGRPFPTDLHRVAARRTRRHRRRVLDQGLRLVRQLRSPSQAGADRQRLLLPLIRLRRRPRTGHAQTDPPLPGPRPTEKSNASTAPLQTNGPTPAPTAQTPNDAKLSQPGSTPTTTSAATPHSADNHQQAASPTSQDRTASAQHAARTCWLTPWWLMDVARNAMLATQCMA